MTRKLLGKYIVADSEICHGKPTFIGTRIMVWQVLRMLARGEDWDYISNAWVAKIPKEAIAEAIELATQALIDHVRVDEPEDTDRNVGESAAPTSLSAVG